MVGIISHLIFSKPSKERLIENLNSQLREEKFEQLYEEADDLVHLNVTKEKFVRRMKIVVTKLKAIDENLAFQRDLETEKRVKAVTENDESVLLIAIENLEKDGKSVSVGLNWTSKGKFFDLWIQPTQGTSEEYNVYGVSAHRYSVKNQEADW
jgi:hypothetical protein